MQNSQTTPENIDEYIANFPKEVQAKLTELRKLIHEIVPEVTETISYKMATFELNGKHLVYFAGFKNHIGFYPFPSGVAAFKEETKDYVTSKGTIQFPLDNPIPHELVRKIVKFRVQENLERAKSKKSGY